MGDFRASIKIQFEMGKHSKEADMWINWVPEEATGVDRRVTEWLAAVAHEGVEKIRDDIHGYRESEAKKDKEERIKSLRKELDRLTSGAT